MNRLLLVVSLTRKGVFLEYGHWSLLCFIPKTCFDALALWMRVYCLTNKLSTFYIKSSSFLSSLGLQQVSCQRLHLTVRLITNLSTYPYILRIAAKHALLLTQNCEGKTSMIFFCAHRLKILCIEVLKYWTRHISPLLTSTLRWTVHAGMTRRAPISLYLDGWRLVREAEAVPDFTCHFSQTYIWSSRFFNYSTPFQTLDTFALACTHAHARTNTHSCTHTCTTVPSRPTATCTCKYHAYRTPIGKPSHIP